jgi:hypothetical protein
VKICPASLLFWSILLIIPRFTNAAEGQVPQLPYINLTAAVSFEGSKKRCLLGITNRADQMPIKNLRVALINDGRTRSELGPIDLEPAQSVILSHDVKPAVSCHGQNVTFLVSFERHGQHNEVLMPDMTANGPASLSALSLGSLIGPAFGLLSGLLGGWVAHFWTVALERTKDRLAWTRERDKERTAWRTDLFRTAEPAFREFLLRWNRSLDAEMLQIQFDALQRAIVVDDGIVRAYRLTYATLAS